MKGRDVALATLMREQVPEPCINYCWMTSSSYMSKAAGRDYWSDREGVFFDYLRACGINLVPQWYFPSEGHKRLEEGKTIGEHSPDGWEKIHDVDDILRIVDALPDDAALERDFNVEETAKNYAQPILDHIRRADDEVLFIDWFGQADFMGLYNRWGYEHYLTAMIDAPEALQRYYHHTAMGGRLFNQAIVLAVRKYGIAPFVYSGQDICTATGPIASPAFLRRYYFPELKWAMEPLVDAGIGVIWHCDGEITPILDDIMDLGVAGMQGFEEEHGVDYADIVKLTDRSGKGIIILGCMSVVTTLPFGTVDDVKAAVRRSFQLAGKGRGFVLSATSSVMPETPHVNIDTMFHYGRSFGREFLGS